MIDRLIELEVQRALKLHGKTNSYMEHIAIVYEEYLEAQEALDLLKHSLTYFWDKLRRNEKIVNADLDATILVAKELIEEAIQIAAVCEKAKSLDKGQVIG
jgi:hypothetical protein